jgi:type IV fimbrial biogenesis protein FimT
MAVVVIIGIFAALAAPAIAGQIADRHVTRAAEDVTGLFRVARSRSAATGAAHAVIVTASASNLHFELRAAVDTSAGVAVGSGPPSANCMAPAWTNADSKLLATVDLDAGDFAGRGIVAVARSTNASSYCITPGGVPWYRSGSAWTHPSGSAYGEWEIYRTDSAGVKRGVSRFVRVGPTGAPRIDVGT